MTDGPQTDRAAQADSPLSGGAIPGLAGAPAFVVPCGADGARLPVLVAVPHAGRRYPPELLARLRHPEQAALKLEDRLADELGRALAEATGAALLVAEAPRAMIDLNRHPADVDWTMFAGAAPQSRLAPPAGGRAAGGLGLVPRRLPGLGELWQGRPPVAEVEARIASVHAPWHACVAAELAALQARWGAALLVDLHSMPPLPAAPGAPRTQVVVGDRFGASCGGMLVAQAFSALAGAGWLAAHNRPYAGGYTLDRHGMPARGRHAVQLEICRTTYLDAQLVAPGPGFAACVAMLCALVRALGEATAAMGSAQLAGGSCAQAAE